MEQKADFLQNASFEGIEGWRYRYCFITGSYEVTN
jgi:hypothetical protein